MLGNASMSKVRDSTPLVLTPCSLACGGFAASLQAVRHHHNGTMPCLLQDHPTLLSRKLQLRLVLGVS